MRKYVNTIASNKSRLTGYCVTNGLMISFLFLMPRVKEISNEMKNSNNNENKIKPNQFFVSVLSGFLATISSHPFEGIKKKRQANLPIQWNLRDIYRGCFAFGSSLIPTTVIQTTANQVLNNNHDQSIQLHLLPAIMSGALGALFSAAAENVILSQQINKFGPKQAFLSITEKSALNIWRGLSMIGIREAIFGLCYLSLANTVGKQYEHVFNSDLPPKIAVGCVGALVSHPFDTTATHMQKHQINSPIVALLKIYNQPGGIQNFFKGGLYRCGLFTFAMLTLNKSPDLINAVFAYLINDNKEINDDKSSSNNDIIHDDYKNQQEESPAPKL